MPMSCTGNLPFKTIMDSRERSANSGSLWSINITLGRPDVGKAKGMTDNQRTLADAKSAAVTQEIEHDESAVIAKAEKTPLGHGEFFHQLVVSGELLQDFENGITWESVRNVDNTAGKFDWEWLVTLGMFLEKNLDFQGEVCPRVPGLKGGALIKTQGGGLWFTENPSFEATWKEAINEQEKRDTTCWDE